MDALITIGTVGAYYIAFTAAIYHAVPWTFIAKRAMTTDLTAPGLLGYLMSPGTAEYEAVIEENDGGKYPLMAMSTLASGAIKPGKAEAGSFSITEPESPPPVK